MSLKLYNEKRRFGDTPEPEGKQEEGQGSTFVIQKHDARRLHYDFRLEVDGVLKSWAVTKGPSLDPKQKRLAVHVEDHPLSYGDFEGVIPPGQYGSGTVIVWDRGTWQPVGDVAKGYRKGHLEFDLDGEKLRGRWNLVRMANRREEKRENWLLIKVDDEESRPEDAPDVLDELPHSVKSGRTLEEVTADPGDTWNSKPRSKKEAAKKTPPKKQAHEWPKGAKKGALPDFVEPALAKLKPSPPKGDRWLHEIKFDGYRLQARIDHGQVRLLTRSGLDWTERFGDTVASALAALPLETALIDGEVVVQRDNGASDFSALQQDLSEGRSDRFLYYAFDLLHLDGQDLRKAPLIERKALLEKLIPGSQTVKYSEHFEESGDLVLDHACRLSLEGVISKAKTSAYVSGRKGDWIKSKCSMRQEFVIAGFTTSSTSQSAIGSLALGVYEGGKLRHIGRVGTGYTSRIAEDLHRKLEPLQQDKSPFADKLTALARRDLHYVKPELVAEVEFRAWSADGNLRHASFRGLREDKPADEISREASSEPKGSKPMEALPQSTVTFTHPDRIYWPKEGVTKEGLAEYYAQVWSFMAPFVVDRPLSLLRCPEGIEGGQRFFQKHAWRGINKAIHKVADPKDKGGDPLLRITDFDGLMALVQSAVLEIHPWGTTTKNWERPDMITMDLDPGDEVGWMDVVEAARDLKRRFEDVGLAAFVKTSGGKGLHVVAPLEPKANWTKVKAFAKALAVDMGKQEPDKYLAVATKSKRSGRIFIDYLRNGRGSTAVAPYSTRARPGASVSVPLEWSELTEDMTPDYFTVANIGARLSALDKDPWDGFFKAAKPLPGK